MKKTKVSWDKYQEMVEALAKQIKADKETKSIKYIFGVPRGGLVVAVSLSHLLGLPISEELPEEPEDKYLIVDDIADNGCTLMQYLDGCDASLPPFMATLFVKPWSEVRPCFFAEVTEDFIVFPWETIKSAKVDYKK